MLIDLDLAPPPSEIPVRARGPHRYWAVAVALLVLALAGGAAAPGRDDGISQVFSIDAQGVSASLLTAEALYLVRADGRAEAHAVCPGCPEWTSSANAGDRLRLAGDTLIVDGSDRGVTFLDARTGALRWRAADVPVVDVMGGRVATWTPGGGELRVRDLETGRLLWTRPAASFTGDDSSVAVFTDATGVTVVDAADGREAVRRDLDLPRLDAQLFGDRLIVLGGSYLAAYRLTDLSREWLAADVQSYGVFGCAGGLLCAVGTNGLTVLDPADGSVRWTDAKWRTAGPDGVVSEESGRSARVDLATGRVVRDLGFAAPVGDLLLYPEPGRTTVIGLTDDRVRGVLPMVLPRACSTAGSYLACERSDITITVWRL